MIDELRPYPSYRPSGLPSLNEVPTHWDVKRAKYFFREADDRSVTGAEELLSVSHITGVTPRSQKTISMFLAESNVGHKLCQPNDVVVNTMWAWMAALGVARQRGIVSPSYAVYRPITNNGLLPEYVDRLLRTAAYASEYLCASTGINTSRLRLYPEQFLRIPIIRPPEREQAFIVRFLDHADRQVRRCIRAKKKLIALLNEQKQAIIHRAVTRGLDPNVRLKPSRVTWLGDIPEHWHVLRLRNLVTRVTSGSRGWSNYAADVGPLFIRIGNLMRGSLDLDRSDEVRLHLPTSVLAETARTRVNPDDVLLSITAFIGSVAVVPEDIGEAYVSQHVACCRLAAGAANASWVGYVLLSPIGQTHGAMCMNGGTKQGLSLDDVKNHVILIPPRLEQDALVQRIQTETFAAEAGIRAARNEINLLREFFTLLTGEVVTGRLDVREATEQMPDEIEPELLEFDDEAGEGEAGDLGKLEAIAEEAEA